MCLFKCVTMHTSLAIATILMEKKSYGGDYIYYLWQNSTTCQHPQPRFASYTYDDLEA